MFGLTLPWCVGGPDFPRQPRARRKFEDAPIVSLDSFTSMMSCRVESQTRWDWDLNPSLWSLSFASKVNLGVSMSLKRALRRADAGPELSDTAIGKAAARIYQLLQEGDYEQDGRRYPIRGDISKISQLVGLGQAERLLLQNYHFMSSRLAGTRQVRRSINHVVFSSRIVYGCPTFATFTPSERHSGLAVRLMRYRRHDPGVLAGAPEFAPYIGWNVPSLKPSDGKDVEVHEFDLPEYDLRRLMTGRDPLCALQAFVVHVRTILPLLYGYRMCPDCPHCVESACPCMDAFGSNATPMGGSAGRCDAMVGAVEAQKACFFFREMNMNSS